MNDGWLKLHRKIMEKGYYKKSEYVHLWVHLILKANHQPAEWMYKNEIFKIKRGQMITSRKTLSEETGINESKVERILKTFETEQQIEQQNLFTSRLITIINYDDHQDSEQQTNSKRTASEQQVNTNKNNKKEKNDKNKEYNVHFHFDEIWNKYPNKIGKKGALRHFKSNIKSDDDYCLISSALNKYINSDRVKNGYIQNGDTWFNNWRDWIDFIETNKKVVQLD